MIIRNAQIQAFESNMIEGFMSRVLEHIKELFPAQFTELGEINTRDVIRFGIEVAKHYGIDSEPCVTRYIDLMLIFGVDFDLDADFPWASSILNDKSIKSQVERINLLCDVAKTEVETIKTNTKGR